jgi:hypothetical protein
MCQSARVERSGAHPNQHVVSPDLGQVSVRQPQDLRRAEPVLDDSLHRVLLVPSRRVVVIDARPSPAGRCPSMTGQASPPGGPHDDSKQPILREQIDGAAGL